MTDYISSPRDMLASGNSSRLAAHRTKMGRDANGDIAAAIAPARNADASPLPTTNSSTPGRASVTAQAAAPAKPTAKLSDEQLHLNYRAAAVLMHPKAEGKGDAVMAMLNADKRLTAAQAITRLDALPFDDPKRQAEAKAKVASDVWDAAYAGVFPNYRTGAEISSLEQDGAAAPTSSSDTKPSASDIWDHAYARVPDAKGSSPTTPTARSKPNATDVWDKAYPRRSGAEGELT